MSTLWIRELRSDSLPGNTGLWVFMKSTALFLQHCCGWSEPGESVGGSGKSFFSYSSNGVDGELNPTGTDKNLRDAVYNAFSGADVGRFAVVCDSSHPINAGVYKITACPSSDVVTLDFRSGVAEYPTNAAGLSWYIFDPVTGVPSTGNDYFQLKSPSALGWAVRLMGNGSFTYGADGLKMRVSLSGDWTNGPILPPTTEAEMFFSHQGAGGGIYWYLCVDSEGKWLIPMSHNSDVLYPDDYAGFMACELESAYPAGYPQYAKFAIMGATYQIYMFSPLNWRGIYGGNEYLSTSCGEGMIWWPQFNYRMRCILTEHSCGAAAQGLTVQTSPARVVNTRTGKWDVFKPGLLSADVGAVGGMMSMYRYYIMPGRPQGWYDCSPAVGRRTAFDCDGTKDKFHMNCGWCFDWPGVTPQY